VAERVRDPRRRPRCDRALRRPLPPPPAQRAQLADAARGASDLGGSTQHRGLNRLLRKGAGHQRSRSLAAREPAFGRS
jgi:hypothetical protein